MIQHAGWIIRADVVCVWCGVCWIEDIGMDDVCWIFQLRLQAVTADVVCVCGVVSVFRLEMSVCHKV
jgi:hypothetical protein